jgi:Holliday junction DNA helicase RuvA
LTDLILDVNGVGYHVEVPLSIRETLPEIDGEVSLFIHTHVREDEIRLFGFRNSDELSLFLRLLKVSGVGPKLALAALGQMTPGELQQAIVGGDVKTLTSISGIGKRTAERIVVDLASGLRDLQVDGDVLLSSTAGQAGGKKQGLHQALQYLGYREKEIIAVIRSLENEIRDGLSVEALLKNALERMN